MRRLRFRHRCFVGGRQRRSVTEEIGLVGLGHERFRYDQERARSKTSGAAILLRPSRERSSGASAQPGKTWLKQEARKPEKSDHGFLASEFPYSAYLRVSCSNFDFSTQTLLLQGF